MGRAATYGLLLVLAYVPGAIAQVPVVLQNHWEPASGSWSKIVPGTYLVNDVESDGVIRILNKRNVRIDGDSVTVHGAGFAGYFIYIENSDSVTLRNFRSVDSMYYAVFARNSRHITIENSNFSNNRKDSIGFIDVWTDVDGALGGGVLLDSSAACSISSCVMKNSNDGIALYHCDSITIFNNDLSWNTSFGVRMFWTNRSWIHHNNCSHTNRLTDQSDCGAILMIVSNLNRIGYNDLTYSGDGIFLGQYGHHGIPNNNIFEYNDGSYSPHNAFEATFASGNIFRHNKANNSDYGFWLGYSFMTEVDSNEILNNQTAGIAVDRGYSNTFRSNSIRSNPIGVWLWEGGSIPGYESWNSREYWIEGCTMAENGVALSASNTEDLMMQGDTVAYNANGLYFEGSSAGTIISGSTLHRNVRFHIENASPSDLNAANNAFGVDDTLVIAGKIYDRQDNPAVGKVTWRPFVAGAPPAFQLQPPGDLTEPPSLWTVYASDGRHTAARWDSTQKKDGDASLRVTTESGFDVMMQFWPAGDSIGAWNLSSATSLTFWVLASNVHPFQEFSVRIGNEVGGYFQFYGPASLLTSAVGSWKQYSIPLAGDATWSRATVGAVTLGSISYVQIHADTWDAGFTLWIDGLSFGPLQEVPGERQMPAEFALAQNYPNPFNAATMITYEIPVGTRHVADPALFLRAVSLQVFDVLGRLVAVLVDGQRTPGRYTCNFDGSGLASGVYVYRLQAGGMTAIRKMMLLR